MWPKKIWFSHWREMREYVSSPPREGLFIRSNNQQHIYRT